MQQRIEEIAKKTKDCIIDKQRIFQFFQQLTKQQQQYEKTKFEYLGNGTFALVIKAIKKNGQQPVALKVVHYDENEPCDVENMLKEYNLLLKVKQCPYLIDVQDQYYIYEDKIVFEDSDDDEQKGESKKENEKIKTFLVLELEYCESKDNFIINYKNFIKKQIQYPQLLPQNMIELQFCNFQMNQCCFQ